MLNQELIDTLASKGKVKGIIGSTKTASKLKTSQKVKLLEEGYIAAKKLNIAFSSQEELMQNLTQVVHKVHKG